MDRLKKIRRFEQIIFNAFVRELKVKKDRGESKIISISEEGDVTFEGGYEVKGSYDGENVLLNGGTLIDCEECMIEIHIRKHKFALHLRHPNTIERGVESMFYEIAEDGREEFVAGGGMILKNYYSREIVLDMVKDFAPQFLDEF